MCSKITCVKSSGILVWIGIYTFLLLSGWSSQLSAVRCSPELGDSSKPLLPTTVSLAFGSSRPAVGMRCIEISDWDFWGRGEKILSSKVFAWLLFEITFSSVFHEGIVFCVLYFNYCCGNTVLLKSLSRAGHLPIESSKQFSLETAVENQKLLYFTYFSALVWKLRVFPFCILLAVL